MKSGETELRKLRLSYPHIMEGVIVLTPHCCDNKTGRTFLLQANREKKDGRHDILDSDRTDSFLQKIMAKKKRKAAKKRKTAKKTKKRKGSKRRR